MPTQHRAINSLVKNVKEQVTKAMCALESADQELKTIQHLIDQEHWWHEEDVKRPTMYRYGPIEGTKKDLAKWIFPDLTDARCIENANRIPGIIWVVKVPENRPQRRFQVWFTSKSMFEDAQSKKVSKFKAH